MATESIYRFLVELSGEDALAQAEQLAKRMTDAVNKVGVGAVVKQLAQLEGQERSLGEAIAETNRHITSQTRRFSYNMRRLREVGQAVDELVRKEQALVSTLASVAAAADPFRALVVSAHTAYTEIVGGSIIPDLTRDVLKELVDMKKRVGTEGVFQWSQELGALTDPWLARLVRDTHRLTRELQALEAHEPILRLLTSGRVLVPTLPVYRGVRGGLGAQALAAGVEPGEWWTTDVEEALEYAMMRWADFGADIRPYAVEGAADVLRTFIDRAMVISGSFQEWAEQLDPVGQQFPGLLATSQLFIPKSFLGAIELLSQGQLERALRAQGLGGLAVGPGALYPRALAGGPTMALGAGAGLPALVTQLEQLDAESVAAAEAVRQLSAQERQQLAVTLALAAAASSAARAEAARAAVMGVLPAPSVPLLGAGAAGGAMIPSVPFAAGAGAGGRGVPPWMWRMYEQWERGGRPAGRAAGGFGGMLPPGGEGMIPEMSWVQRWELFGRALNRATLQYYGLRRLSWDVEFLGRSVKRTGDRTLGMARNAAEAYLEFNKLAMQAAVAMELPIELMGALEEQTMAVSEELGLFPAEEITEGLYHWAAGIGVAISSEEDLNRILQDTVGLQKLAAMNSEDLGDIAIYTGAAMKAFDLNVEDLDHVLEVFNYTALQSFATVSDVGETFKFLGPVASAMGDTFETTASMVALLSDENTRASMAGRGLRQMYIRLMRPTAAVSEEMDKLLGTSGMLGDSWRDIIFPEDQFVGAAQYIDILAAATENLTEAERANALAILATANELPTLIPLIESQIEAREVGVNVIRAMGKLRAGVIDEEVRDYLELTERIKGYTQSLKSAHQLWEDMWEFAEQQLGVRADRARRRWETSIKRFGRAVAIEALPAVEASLDILTDAVGLVSRNPWMVKTILLGGAVMAGAGTLVIFGAQLLRAYTNWKIMQAAWSQTQIVAAEMQMTAAQMQMQAAGLQVPGGPAPKAPGGGGWLATLALWAKRLSPIIALGVLGELQAAEQERKVVGLYPIPERYPREVQEEFRRRYEWIPGGPTAGPTLWRAIGDEADSYLETTEEVEAVLNQIAAGLVYLPMIMKEFDDRTEDATGSVQRLEDGISDLYPTITAVAWPPKWLGEIWDEALRAYQDYLDDLEDIDGDYMKDKERRLEDHEDKMRDFVADRDATGILKEIREYEKREAREEEDYAQRRSEFVEDSRERLGEMVGYYSTEEEYYKEHIDAMIEEFRRFVEAQEGFWAEYPKAFPVVPEEYLEQVAETQKPYPFDVEGLEAAKDALPAALPFGPEYVEAMKRMQEAWTEGILVGFGGPRKDWEELRLREELAGAPGRPVIHIDQSGWRFQGSFSAVDKEGLLRDVKSTTYEAVEEVLNYRGP